MANEVRYNIVQDYLRSVIRCVTSGEVPAGEIGACMIWGPPGIGKSALVRGIANELGIGFVDIRLAQMESIDIRGIPMPNKEKRNVDWYPSAIFPTEEGNGGIIFLDELSACPKDVQVASYELINDRQLGGGKIYKVPSKWVIVAAGNRTCDSAVSIRMSSALSNRVTHFEMTHNFDDWFNWALGGGIHPSVTGFLQLKPSLLYKTEDENLERGYPTPRSWERVSSICKIAKSDLVLDAAVKGLVGEAVGREFMAFHKTNKEFANALRMMTNEAEPVVIPKQTHLCWALCSALIYHLYHATTPDECNVRIDGFFRVMMKIPNSFAAMVMHTITKTAPSPLRRAMMLKPNYRVWQKKFSEYMNKDFEIGA